MHPTLGAPDALVVTLERALDLPLWWQERTPPGGDAGPSGSGLR